MDKQTDKSEGHCYWVKLHIYERGLYKLKSTLQITGQNVLSRGKYLYLRVIRQVAPQQVPTGGRNSFQ